VTVARPAALLCLVLCLAGCASSEPVSKGGATLWITTDRGSHVLHTTRVRAGMTALQALASVAKVGTRYGGRFVQSIDGVEGSLSRQRDWFYYVNGYEADRSAAEYRLRPGDVEWWDYRSWSGSAGSVPVVIGSYPEPFVHGYDGKTRPVVVEYMSPELESAARILAGSLHASKVLPRDSVPAAGTNVLRLQRGPKQRFYPDPSTPVSKPGDPVTLVVEGSAAQLARNPARFRFRFAVR
jgi:uncharacterized protein DUF4430